MSNSSNPSTLTSVQGDFVYITNHWESVGIVKAPSLAFVVVDGHTLYLSNPRFTVHLDSQIYYEIGVDGFFTLEEAQARCAELRDHRVASLNAMDFEVCANGSTLRH